MNEEQNESEREKARQYYAANREKILEQKRKYREANREKIAERKRTQIRSPADVNFAAETIQRYRLFRRRSFNQSAITKWVSQFPSLQNLFMNCYQQLIQSPKQANCGI